MFMYLNGEMIPAEQANISIFDHGYLYGVGLFETFRTYKGHPFLLENHLQRLEEGCKQVGMVWKRNDSLIREQISELLEQNKLEDGYFRLNLSAGAHPIGLPHTHYQDLTEAIFVKKLPPVTKTKKLVTVRTRRNTPEGEVRLKSHHYLNNILAKREVPLDAEGVLLTKEGKVAEGIVSTLFFIKGEVLYTPSLQTGILKGITRECVFKIANVMGMKVKQGEYDLHFAQESDEVFICNSIQEIVSVDQWDKHSYEVGEQGITQKVKQLYHHYKYRLDHLNQFSAKIGP